MRAAGADTREARVAEMATVRGAISSAFNDFKPEF